MNGGFKETCGVCRYLLKRAQPHQTEEFPVVDREAGGVAQGGDVFVWLTDANLVQSQRAGAELSFKKMSSVTSMQ